MTKVFVLSLHRVGTTSCHQFLTRFGLRSKHCPKLLGDENFEAKIEGRESDLEFVAETLKPVFDACDAVSDVPVPALWRFLPEMYPGAKFILLTRPAADWAASVRVHAGGRKLAPFERAVYWRYFKRQPESVDAIGDDDLERFFGWHGETVMRNMPSGNLFVGHLYNRRLGEALTKFLGLPYLPRFPHRNSSSEASGE